MSRTTGPVLAMGGITLVNRTVFSGKPMDWRIPVATGLLAVGFDLFEHVWPKGAELLAWTGVIAVVLTRTSPDVPSPAEAALDWWNHGQAGGALGGGMSK